MNHFNVLTTKEEREKAGIGQYRFMEDTGEVTAVLDFRAWGKYMNLGCFFQTEKGRKFCVYLWRSKINPDIYGPRTESVNFAEVKDKTRWKLFFSKTRNGRVYLTEAEEIK